MSGRQVVPGSAEMQEDGTQYRQCPWATRSATARMLSTVPSRTVGVKPATRHISTVNWLNSGARTSSASSTARRPGRRPGWRPVRRAGGRAEPGPQRIVAEQVRVDLRRCERGPADADVQAAVGELPILPGHAGLDLVDHQGGVAGLDVVQDLRHRAVAGVDDARSRETCSPLRRCGAVRVGQICGLGVTPPRKSISRIWWALRSSRRDGQLPPQSLSAAHATMAHRAEMQLLGQGHEITQLTQLHARRPPCRSLAAATIGRAQQRRSSSRPAPQAPI